MTTTAVSQSRASESKSIPPNRESGVDNREDLTKDICRRGSPVEVVDVRGEPDVGLYQDVSRRHPMIGGKDARWKAAVTTDTPCHDVGL